MLAMLTRIERPFNGSMYTMYMYIIYIYVHCVRVNNVSIVPCTHQQHGDWAYMKPNLDCNDTFAIDSDKISLCAWEINRKNNFYNNIIMIINFIIFNIYIYFKILGGLIEVCRSVAGMQNFSFL